MSGESDPNPVLDAIRSRRVVRAMTDEPIPRETLERILDAARWAPTAGNRHLQRFVASDDPGTLRALRMVSPGMLQRPVAVVGICVDRDLAVDYGFARHAHSLSVDVGTAAATLLLAAHALGVGGGPVTSFSRAAVGAVLDVPAGWTPEFLVCLGHPAPGGPGALRRGRRVTWQDLTVWAPRP
ncbi:MAG: nitroreductase family protein [Pseudonocardia sp.]|uniref:nitroreductase family protein n=1 Tax=unclassified Pseudonocardia TaxID=2619320 RepID=UPI000868F1FE|nr:MULTISPECIES: nitroreductase family protein [unclassified Pseudonocardia]MBN9112028.1 nitroreductase family protein [Pseudonocardia sp.]ODU26205.1 MAG: hypothetical protein ABS80_07935 [Pseudonocardia sp. SCN 72-51]ODV06048.1 MAG: hypothetical protein ABT15_14650 [Pseudonocardia sp. SCN 73-27]